MFFDTHAHYDDEAFEEDREPLLSRLNGEGIDYIIDPGCDLKSSQAALALAEHYPFVYAAVGFHPEELEKYCEIDFQQIEKLATHPKCVAIGEIGLDYYWDASHKTEQKVLFRRQIDLALALDKPVIVHDREAHGDCLEIVRDYPGLRGVFHCYSGSTEMAAELLKLGWYLGFDGPVTYKNARKALEVAAALPLERIVLETDCPYMSPEPFRGKRNDPGKLYRMAQALAALRGLSEEAVQRVTLENGRRLYRI